MVRPILRVDLCENVSQFRPIALEPGLPMLDEANTNISVLRRWLGRHVAESGWEGKLVCFYVGDGQGGKLDVAACRPVTAARLRGPLKKELDDFTNKLAKVRPQGYLEQLLHKVLAEDLRGLNGTPLLDDLGCNLFEYKDGQGNWRLVWCWGYRRADQQAAAAVVCPNPQCGLLWMNKAKRDARCPGCHRRLGFPWRLAAAGTAALILAAAAAVYGWLLLPTSTLVGRVASVANQKPVPSAVVSLVGTDRSVKTDDQGQFRFDRLRAGPLRVRAVAERFDAKTVEVKMMRATETWTDIALLGGNFPGGIVVDADDSQPLANARVSISNPVSTTLLTGKDGKFTFAGVDAPEVDIQATAPGYRGQIVQWSRASDAFTVKLTGSATLEGQVVNKMTGAPVSSASVGVAKRDKYVKTDGQGRYRLENLPGGAHAVEAVAPGLACWQRELSLPADQETKQDIELMGAALVGGKVIDAASGKPVADALVSIKDTTLKVSTGPEGEFQFSSAPVGATALDVVAAGYRSEHVEAKLTEGNNAPLQFSLLGHKGLSGMVVYGGGEKTVPIRDAEISIAKTDLKATTDQDGQFNFPAIPPGPQTVRVAKQGFADVEVAADFAADGGESVRRIAITGAAALNGRVVDAAYDPPKPIVGATVAVDESPLALKTDAEGAFAIGGVRGGPVRLQVSQPDYIAKAYEINAQAATAVGDIPLLGDAALSGAIIDEKSKQPIADAEVRIAGTKLSAKTDARGAYNLAAIPSGREVKVEVTAEKYGDYSQAKALSTGSAELDIAMVRDTTLALQIVDAANRQQPVADADVRITALGLDRQAKTDKSGRVVFSHVPGRPTKVDVSADLYCSKQIEGTPADKPVTIPLTPAAVLVIKAVQSLPIRLLAKRPDRCYLLAMDPRGFPLQSAILSDDGLQFGARLGRTRRGTDLRGVVPGT